MASKQNESQPTTTERDVKAIATHATTFMDKADVVRVSQAKNYLAILGDDPFGPGGLYEGVSIDDAADYAAKRKTTPDSLKEKVRDAYLHLPTSHHWLKAVHATAVAVADPDRVTDVAERLAAAEKQAQAEPETTVPEAAEEQAEEQVEGSE